MFYGFSSRRDPIGFFVKEEVVERRGGGGKEKVSHGQSN